MSEREWIAQTYNPQTLREWAQETGFTIVGKEPIGWSSGQIELAIRYMCHVYSFGPGNCIAPNECARRLEHDGKTYWSSDRAAEESAA